MPVASVTCADRALCASSYARLSAVFPGLRVTSGAGCGPGWVGVADLARGGAAADAFVAGDAGRLAGAHGRVPRPDVSAALALHRYLWPACLLFTVPWFLQRRVPQLPVGRVAFHPVSGRFALAPHTVVGLPDDPAAAQPGSGLRTVPDEAALRAGLRSALAAHLAPVLAQFGPRMRRGPHAMWRTATDEIAEGLHYIGQLLGQEQRARAALAVLLPGGTPPFDAPASYDGPSRTRLTCCLFYTVSPADACRGCPRTACAGEIRPRSRAR